MPHLSVSREGHSAVNTVESHIKEVSLFCGSGMRNLHRKHMVFFVQKATSRPFGT